jgi:Carboxypeptidase regulatory-like domain/TonB dependent receptor-like, beta-barrel
MRTCSSHLAWLFAVLLAPALLFTSAASQSDSAMLSGRVVDATDLNIEGARVALVSIDRGTVLTTATAKTGLYVFPSVQPGRYMMTVSAKGFTTVNVTNVTLRVQDSLEENLKLGVGSVSESITVEAGGRLVDVSSAVSTNVDQQFVGELPLNGRSFQTLFQLTPGVVITSTASNEMGQFSVNGQRSNANYVTVDGVSANVGISSGGLGQSAGGTVPALSAGGGTNSLVSVDALQEFSIQTSGFAPEYGRTPGGQISILTRSGTNDFHGDAFDYLRNEAVDANDWFANHNGLKKAALRQNDFGGVLGGPIVKNHTFFFLSYEGLRLTQPVTVISDVPDLATRQAAIPAMQPFINAFPLPNGSEEGGGLAFANYTVSNPSHLDTESLRVDHQLTRNVGIFARYNRSRSEIEVSSPGGNFSANSARHFAYKLGTGTAGIVWAIRPTLTNDFRFNWSWSAASQFNTLDSTHGAVPFTLNQALPGQDTSNSFVELLISSSLNATLATGQVTRRNVQQQMNMVDTIDWQSGKHLFKVGVDYRRLTPQYDPVGYQQVAFFDTASEFANGNVGSSVVASDFGPIAATFSNFSLFGQDTWKASGRLTLTYGLRWDYNPAPSFTGQNGTPTLHLQGVEDLTNEVPEPAGSALYHATRDNFAPRLGFSFNVHQAANFATVLRGGVGMFYDLGSGATGFITTSAPFENANFPAPTTFPLSPALATPPPPAFTPPFFPIMAFPETLRQPYTYHYNVGVEQSVSVRQSVSVNYVGASGHSLLRQDFFVSFPNVGTVNSVSNAGYSNYNSLQVQARRRQTDRLELLASYTWAHSLDNASGDAIVLSPVPNVNPASDYGDSDFDLRHTFTAAVDYQPKPLWQNRWAKAVLGGWGLNTFVIARSAVPVTVGIDRDLGFGEQAYRPDQVPGIPVYIRDETAPGGVRLNANAFFVPAAPIQGNLRRNSVRAFGLFQEDFSIRRTFKIGERVQVEGRMEVFNIFNHPNFAPQQNFLGFVDSSGTLTPNPGFGTSTSMFNVGTSPNIGLSGFNPLYQVGGPRSLQGAIKVRF